MKPVAIFRHSPTKGAIYFATYPERLHIVWKQAPRTSRSVEQVIARPTNLSVGKIRSIAVKQETNAFRLPKEPAGANA